ncbi:glycosyltransferase [Lentisphaerota bacterium ZTH]|nr:glycosyltransferase [Lentisphaerota bacterium]WET06403.1 glycosyltransferase [Lentisphaerota bacterium ZTH]
MKILHVNYYDKSGGAAKAARRLHKGLLTAGIDSKMLVVEKRSSSESVIACSRKVARKLQILQRVEALLLRTGSRNPLLPQALNLPHSPVLELINRSDADIVNLHWINGCMLGIKDLPEINKPVVWTLHDAWPYCGTEHHHNSSDNSFVRGYKRAKSYGFFDWAPFNWRRKMKYWRNWHPITVAPSKWLNNEARKSMIFKDCNNLHIPNGLNLNVFKSTDKSTARKELGIPDNKKVIALGAFDVKDRNKGGVQLNNALKILEQKYGKQIELLVIGNGTLELPFKSYNTGFIANDKPMANIYPAADVFISASKYEAFGYMLVEASACGIPCVAFATGGIPDIVKHRETGYLAKCFQPEDLAAGIEFALQNTVTLGENAAKYCRKNFDLELVAKQYIQLYKGILNEEV